MCLLADVSYIYLAGSQPLMLLVGVFFSPSVHSSLECWCWLHLVALFGSDKRSVVPVTVPVAGAVIDVSVVFL